MIWKYKRCYQEESFTPPLPETDCFKLISIQLSSVINPPLSGSVSSINLNINRCTNVYESTNIPEGVLIPVGFCIQPTSIEIDTVLAGITVPQVENAIANNSGVIIIPIIVGEDTVANVTFTFGICGEEQPPNALAIRSNPINDFNLLICEEPMLNDCKIYVQSGTDVITTGDYLYNVNNTIFNGDNKYYRIQLSLLSPSEPSYLCQVNNSGEITVLDTCPGV